MTEKATDPALILATSVTDTTIKFADGKRLVFSWQLNELVELGVPLEGFLAQAATISYRDFQQNVAELRQGHVLNRIQAGILGNHMKRLREGR